MIFIIAGKCDEPVTNTYFYFVLSILFYYKYFIFIPFQTFDLFNNFGFLTNYILYGYIFFTFLYNYLQTFKLF